MPWAWDDANTAVAFRLWGEGKSATVIAKAIGCPSRNAVVGKLSRGGATRDEPSAPTTSRAAAPIAKAPRAVRMPAAKPIQAAPQPRPVRPPPAPPPPPPPPRTDEEIVAGAVPLTGLSVGGCRYPVGRTDGPGLYLFCNAPAAGEGEPWCLEHKRLCVSAHQGRPGDLARLGRPSLSQQHHTAGNPNR